MTTSIWHWDSNPRPSEHESPPITTRPLSFYLSQTPTTHAPTKTCSFLFRLQKFKFVHRSTDLSSESIDIAMERASQLAGGPKLSGISKTFLLNNSIMWRGKSPTSRSAVVRQTPANKISSACLQYNWSQNLNQILP